MVMLMAEYRPGRPFDTPMLVFPVRTVEEKGSAKKRLQDPFLIYASCASFGGTETTRNDILVIEDTWNIETWYRPDIDASCLVAFADVPHEQYEIIGTPENIHRRCQFLKFKIRRIGGVS